MVRTASISRPARIMRLGDHVTIQLRRSLSPSEMARYGMHELCHFWRDDPGEPCYYAEDEDVETEDEHFADVFAWAAVSGADLSANF